MHTSTSRLMCERDYHVVQPRQWCKYAKTMGTRQPSLSLRLYQNLEQGRPCCHAGFRPCCLRCTCDPAEAQQSRLCKPNFTCLLLELAQLYMRCRLAAWASTLAHFFCADMHLPWALFVLLKIDQQHASNCNAQTNPLLNVSTTPPSCIHTSAAVLQ